MTRRALVGAGALVGLYLGWRIACLIRRCPTGDL